MSMSIKASIRQKRTESLTSETQFLSFRNSCQCPSYIFPKSCLHTCVWATAPHSTFTPFSDALMCVFVFLRTRSFSNKTNKRNTRDLAMSRSYSSSSSSDHRKLAMKTGHRHPHCPLRSAAFGTWSFLFCAAPPEATEFADGLYHSWFLAAFPLPFFLRFLLSIKAT